MTTFERIIAAMPDLKCDICGAVMVALHGKGIDSDRIYCSACDCAAEITFPTSTEVKP